MDEIFPSKSFYSKSAKKFKLTLNPTVKIVAEIQKSPLKHKSKRHKSDKKNPKKNTKLNKTLKQQICIKNKIKIESDTNIKKDEESETGTDESYSASKKFFKRRMKGNDRIFTIQNFQPYALQRINNKGNVSGLDMYKLMSNCVSDNYEDDEMEDDESSDDDDSYCSGEDEDKSDNDSEEDDGKSDNEEDGEEHTTSRERQNDCLVFSLVSDDEDKDENDDFLKDLNEDIWDKLDDDFKENEGGNTFEEYKSNIKKSATKEQQKTVLSPITTTSHAHKTPDSPPQTNKNNPPKFDSKSLSFLSDDMFGMKKDSKSSFVPKAPADDVPSEGKLLQMTLDFGQKLKEPMVCKGCGLTYNDNQSNDNAFHLKYHRQYMSCFQYHMRQKDEVVGSYVDGCVIQLANDFINSPKMEQLLLEVDKDIGMITSHKPIANMKLFVYVMEKKIVGICMVENITKAYRRLDEQGDTKKRTQTDIEKDKNVYPPTSLTLKKLSSPPSSHQKPLSDYFKSTSTKTPSPGIQAPTPNNHPPINATTYSSCTTLTHTFTSLKTPKNNLKLTDPIPSTHHPNNPPNHQIKNPSILPPNNQPHSTDNPRNHHPSSSNHHHTQPSTSSDTAEIARVGINRIWMQGTCRRKGLASRMLNAVRGYFCLGVPLKPSDFAFFNPTTDACSLATHFTNTSNFLVYFA